MEIMQQQGSSPLDGRWRGHVPLPYAAHGMALPSSVHPLRQHQQQQRPHHHLHQQQQQHHHHPQQQQQEQQQQQQLQLQQQLQQHQHRHLLKQPRPQLAEAGSSRDHSQPSSSSSSSSSSTSSHSLHASPQPSPHAPAPGKSGGTKEEGEKKEGGEWEQYNAGAAFLGPTLWDKTISYDSDLKLEYMDLDEFLNENGIPIEEASKVMRGGGGGVGAHTGTTATTTKSGGDNTGGGGGTDLTSPTASVSPEAASPSSPDGTPMGLGVVPQGPPPPGTHSVLPQVPTPATPAPPPPHSAPPPCLSPDNMADEYCSSSDSGSPHSPALQVHEGDSVRASLGRDSNKVRRGGGGGVGGGGIVGHNKLSAPEPINGEHIGLNIDFEVSPNDLALATVPGQDFDPRTRCFSEEELKPQPMIKKSRKQFVPMELKDEKYWARRRKNNLAAKRSRDARRLKENQIAMRANFLEKENDALTSELQKAQAVVEALKKRLAVYEVV